MLMIRPIRESDSANFIALVYQMSIGMRSLPKNQDRLMQKIIQSVESFKKTTSLPQQEQYLFVLEETSTGQIAGTSSIWTAQAAYWEDYFYRRETHRSLCPWTGAAQEIDIFKIVLPKEDLSKIGSLYLHPAFRHHRIGPLLSLSRFLFAAGHPNRFFPTVIAELRGVIQADQTCPFWNGIGRHFCNVSFVELFNRLDLDDSMIPKILPTHPIYISLLPKDVQETIGAVHESTRGALRILLKEGFRLTNDIDLFDGGPKVEADLREIHTVKESRTVVLGQVKADPVEGMTYILSNDRLDFRACYGTMQIDADNQAILTHEVAAALNLTPGDTFRAILS